MPKHPIKIQRYTLLLLMFFNFFLSIQMAFAVSPCMNLLRGIESERTSPSESWTPDLSTLRGRIELLMSILERDPHFVAANLSFRRNLLETFAHIPKVVEAVGQDAAPMEIEAPQVLSARYTTAALVYDQKRVQSFRQSRISEAGKLKLLPGASLLEQLSEFKQDEMAVKRIFKLLPFLFDSKGNPKFKDWNEATRQELREAIEKSTPSDWENGYFDMMKGHIEPLLERFFEQKEMGQLKRHYQRIRNRFIEKEVQAATQTTSAKGATPKVRTLSIESVPSSVAAARGCYGGDCSILSVPFYALLNGVQVHFIRKSKDLNTRPDGYMVSAKVSLGGSRHGVPYIITINGATLTKADIRVASALLLKSHGSKKVVFPNWDENPHVVNWEVARQAMTHHPGHEVKVTLPSGWKTLDEYHNLKNRTGSANYYRSEAVEKGVMGEFSPDVHFIDPIETTHSNLPSYSRPRAVSKMNLLERAIIANQALGDTEAENQRDSIFRALSVDSRDVEAATPLISLSRLTLQQYRDLEQYFGYGLKDILGLAEERRARILSDLYEKFPVLMLEHDARTNPKVRQTLINHYRGESHGSFLERVWDARDISDANLIHILQELQHILKRRDANAYLTFLAQFQGTSIELEAASHLAQHYLSDVSSDITLARDLNTIFSPDSSVHRDFGQAILARGMETEGFRQTYPSLAVYDSIIKRNRRSGENRRRFKESLESWFSDGNINASKKADFLLTLVGQGWKIFHHYLRLLPKTQTRDMWARMNQRSSLKSFLELAKKQGKRDFLLTHAKPESFLFSSTGQPQAGKPVTFEMGEKGKTKTVTLERPIQVAVTAETDLLWILVMGENPSIIHTKSRHFSRGIKFSNRPVEGVTWWSAVWYANERSKLEGLKPVYDLSHVKFSGSAAGGTLRGNGKVKVDWKANGYRLPTEAEQEYYIRGGTNTLYSFGDDRSLLSEYGHYHLKRTDRTRPVAELLPNPFGLYDVHGNIWEWGWDWKNEELKGVKNPTEPQLDSYRVVRGGSWEDGVTPLQSAFRSFRMNDERDSDIGFRLVRAAQ